MRKIDEVYGALIKLEKDNKNHVSATELSNYLKIDRSNVSRYLNKLYKNGKIQKNDGRPVLYYSIESKNISENNRDKHNSLDKMIGAQLSLRVPIQQAKAAILYPPRGLHTLILGETGVGKSMFAELMYQFAKQANVIQKQAPFIRFNCADYADNPQLVVAQIFGVKKGAYTGADSDKEGLLKKAHGGILFLDEIHRLSPQGQEMLFTYIDKGFFRLLGDTDKVTEAQVQIIAATTEDPESYLLRTFTRRIPMIIKLPPLKDRTLKERYYLLKEFIITESKRLSKNIYIDKNALASFLLYDCPNNIGQLKSDIQLSCAKAFLDFKTKNLDYIFIEQSDLPKNTKKGFMKIQNYREEINNLLKNKGDILVFSNNAEGESSEVLDETEDHEEENYFYDSIEEKLTSLKNEGMEEKEINDILNIDIERHFKRYMSDLPEIFRKEEISKVVNLEIVAVVEEILSVAGKKLNREFDDRIHLGLALHLQRSIDRIRQGNSIYHPKLNFIRAQYADEFMVSIEIARIIDNHFNIETPLDEIGYLTMFLASNQYEDDMKFKEAVGILVIMHGKSTASSMAQVTNQLLGEECVQALDMPLNMKVEDMYEIAKKKVIEMNRGRGVLILVDMGSLTNFENMIYEETGIDVRTIDMASTPIVIEACRKSIIGSDLQSIYNSCKNLNRYGIQVNLSNNHYKKFLIITACFTGEGASEKLKNIIADSLGENLKLDIVSLNILDKNDFLAHIENLNKEYNIIAVVGTINIFIKNVPFISASEILGGTGLERLNNLIKKEDQYNKIKKSLKVHINMDNVEDLIDMVKILIEDIEEKLNITIQDDVKVGILLHISFMVDRVKNGSKQIVFHNADSYISKYNNEFIIVKQTLKHLEKNYNISICKDEEVYILRMFMENSTSV